MIALRASKGLGDAIHLRAAVLHLLDRGEAVVLFNKFPEVFADLPVTVFPLDDGDRREGLRHFAYRLARDEPTVDNFTAACQRAEIAGPVELTLRWTVRNRALIDRIVEQAKGRRIFVYQTRKIAHNGPQELLRPSREAYNGFIAEHHDHFRIKLGQPPYVETESSSPCELDLFGKASIADAFDIGTIGDLFFGESCYVPMLGEAMDKRFAMMFTRRALNSSDRVRYVRPERNFHKMHLGLAVYDES